MTVLSADRDLKASVQLGALSDSLGFMLRLAQIRAFEDYFTEYSDLDLSPGTISVLTIIEANPGIRQGVLARRLRIKPANMTKMVQAMETEKLVKRRVPDGDRRAYELVLTDRGRERVNRFLERFRHHEMQSLAPLEPAERAELMRLLTKYVGLRKEETR